MDDEMVTKAIFWLAGLIVGLLTSYFYRLGRGQSGSGGT